MTTAATPQRYIKSAGSFIAALHHISIAKQFFADVTRDNPGTRTGSVSRQYAAKCQWIEQDSTTHNFLPDFVRQRIRTELNSDTLAIIETQRKLSKLHPAQRELIETAIEHLLTGGTINIDTK